MPTTLASEKEVIRFSILASVSCLVAATVGVVSLRVAGAVPRGDFLINWATWWVGDTIGTLIFAPLVIIWSFRTRDSRRKLSVSMPMALAFATVVVLFFQASRSEQDHIKLEFEQRTDALAQRLQRDFDGYLGVLRSNQSFFASSSSVDRKSFHTFVARDFTDHPGIQALSWNPRVREAERTAFEEGARRDGSEAFQITELDAGSNLIRAASRDEYISVRYLEPSAGNERALGFDAASDPIRRKAMERSRDSGEPVATEKIALVQDVGRSSSFVVYLPIYSSDVSNTTAERRRRQLQGYVAAVFRIGDVISQSLTGIERNGIELRLVDETTPSAKQFLFGTSHDIEKKTRLGAEQSTVEGTGLGLALSKRLMHAMGGGIGASSTVGRGSTFWVELPRAEAPAHSLAPPETPVLERTASTAKCTILYIKDNLSNLSLVEEILSEQPEIELLSAMQGRLGLDLARKHSPDLILLDLHLPDLPGSEVLSQLQADETTRHIPVIVISADATARQIERLMTAGAQDYLTKPLDVIKFSRIVEETTRHTNRIKQSRSTVESTV